MRIYVFLTGKTQYHNYVNVSVSVGSLRSRHWDEVRSTRGLFGSNTLRDKSKTGEESLKSVLHVWQSQSTQRRVPEQKLPIRRFWYWEEMASSLEPPLYSVTGGGIPGKSMALVWKLRWTWKVLPLGISITVFFAAEWHVLSLRDPRGEHLHSQHSQSLLSKLICKFNAISVKMPTWYDYVQGRIQRNEQKNYEEFLEFIKFSWYKVDI